MNSENNPEKELIHALAVIKKQSIQEFDTSDFAKLKCYKENCYEKPVYTIGTLLPSIWFDQRATKKLIPVVYVACMQHRFDILDSVPERTVAVVTKDVSKASHELVSKLLSNAMDQSCDEIVYFMSTS